LLLEPMTPTSTANWTTFKKNCTGASHAV
jgi:hypothetical protein